MKKQNSKTNTITPDKEAKFVHYSDGSELIPSEVNFEHQGEDSLVGGYTKDDEGIINNYALEPGIYLAKYPNQKQQLSYIIWGAGAIAFVADLLVVAFVVS